MTGAPPPSADRRLDRLEHFDPRSRAFPIRALVALPPMSRSWDVPLWLDQGAEGACVGFAWSHSLAARPSSVDGVTAKFARESIYWQAQQIDPWPGGSYPGAEPPYEGTAVLAGAKVIKSLGWIAEYRWAFGLSDLVLAVGYAGPAVLGVSWLAEMFTPDADGFLRVEGDVVGGHAILCRAVDVEAKTFTLRNSWGASWGRSGDALIRWDDLARLLADGGEACIPIGRHGGQL